MSITPLYTDASVRREKIREKALLGLKALFPIEANNHVIDVTAMKVTPKTFSHNDMKKAILEGRSLTEPVTGTIVLRDKSGKVLEKIENFKLLSLPYFTDIHTFIVDGGQYSVGNQLRTKAGVYTDRKSVV